MALSTSQIVAISSAVLSAASIIVGDLSSVALLPAHAVAVVAAIVAAISTAVSTTETVISDIKSGS